MERITKRPIIVAVIIGAVLVAGAIAWLALRDSDTPQQQRSDAMQQAAIAYATAIEQFRDDHKRRVPILLTKDWPDPMTGPLDKNGKPYLKQRPKVDGIKEWVVSSTDQVLVPAIVYTPRGSTDYTISSTTVTTTDHHDQRSGERTQKTTWRICKVATTGTIKPGRCTTRSITQPVSAPPPPDTTPDKQPDPKAKPATSGT